MTCLVMHQISIFFHIKLRDKKVPLHIINLNNAQTSYEQWEYNYHPIEITPKDFFAAHWAIKLKFIDSSF